jgi:hypothetical protein
MILKDAELKELIRYLEVFHRGEGYGDRAWMVRDEEWWNLEDSVTFFSQHPHLLLPLGFDETRALIEPSYGEELVEEGTSEAIKRGMEDAENAEQKFGVPKPTFEFGIEYLFRSASEGTWNWFLGLDNETLQFRGPGRRKVSFAANELVLRLENLVANPDLVPRTFWLPQFWTPTFQEQTRMRLSSNVSAIIFAIQAEKKNLREISPRMLEEIVAELLRSKGMDIYVTPQTRDSGRDIVARGDISGVGDPITIAVEVKHMRTVNAPDLSRTLHANREFPAVLLVTSGSFSAGVIAEQRKPENRLRLMLKDGIAVSEWINAYVA